MLTKKQLFSVLVFDLDDTLYLEREFVLSGFRVVGDWLAANHSISDFYQVAYELFVGGHRGHIFDEALSQLGHGGDRTLIERLIVQYRAHEPQLSLFEDARWALDHFQHQFKLALLTDGYLPTQRNKVVSLGISSYFDVIVYSEEIGRNYWKPSPIPYLRIMQSLDCEGGRCVYVSDNPVKDFVGAKALGWTTIRIVREGGEYSSIVADAAYDAQYRIDNLFKLDYLLMNF